MSRLRASDARNSISRIQGNIDSARSSFTRAFGQMDLENASVERDFEDVRDEILRLMSTIGSHLRGQHFE